MVPSGACCGASACRARSSTTRRKRCSGSRRVARATSKQAASIHFLYGVALRVAAQESKKRRASEPLADLEALPKIVDLGPSPEEQMAARQARELLDDVLDALPAELRVVFVLFELEGLEVREIAALQQLPWAQPARVCGVPVRIFGPQQAASATLVTKKGSADDIQRVRLLR